MIPDTPTIMKVWAPWCAECRAMQPQLEEIAAEHPDVDLVLLNAAERPGDTATLGIRGTPTLIGYSGGREMFRETGRRTPTELRLLFESVESGSAAPAVGRFDVLVRFGAGTVLTVLGMVSGPSWVLVGAGALVGVFGYVTMRRRAIS